MPALTLLTAETMTAHHNPPPLVKPAVPPLAQLQAEEKLYKLCAHAQHYGMRPRQLALLCGIYPPPDFLTLYAVKYAILSAYWRVQYFNE